MNSNMTKVRKLSESFLPASYSLRIVEPGAGELLIIGKKIGRPAKRLTFHQKGLKVTAASLTKVDKRGRIEIEVKRINHHKNFQEVRIHVGELLFPGTYEVKLEFMNKALIKDLKSIESHPLREILPAIDEPGVDAEIKIT